MHPDWTVADILRAAGLPRSTINKTPGREINSQGVRLATIELARTGYRDAIIREVPFDKAAKRIGQLVDSEDGNIALKATVTALEHAGIVERHDQEKVLVYVQQQFVQTVGPVILEAIPRELHGQVLAALRQAAQDARPALEGLSRGAFDRRVGVGQPATTENATGANVERLEGNQPSEGANGTQPNQSVEPPK